VTLELFIFARFHAKEGLQKEVAATINEVLTPTRVQRLIDHPLEVTRAWPLA
jgi:hypothetical protein